MFNGVIFKNQTNFDSEFLDVPQTRDLYSNFVIYIVAKKLVIRCERI